MSSAGVVVTHPDDNVATALEDLRAGQIVPVAGSNRADTVKVLESVNRGHKISLIALDAGQHVLKYGEHIGVTTKFIGVGGHVHTHNLRSMRIGGARSEHRR